MVYRCTKVIELYFEVCVVKKKKKRMGERFLVWKWEVLTSLCRKSWIEFCCGCQKKKKGLRFSLNFNNTSSDMLDMLNIYESGYSRLCMVGRLQLNTSREREGLIFTGW